MRLIKLYNPNLVASNSDKRLIMPTPTKIVKTNGKLASPKVVSIDGGPIEPAKEQESLGTVPVVPPDYPVIIQRYKPEGVEVEILNLETLNVRKLEIGHIQSLRKLRLLRVEETRHYNAAAQVVTNSAEEVRLNEPEESSWQQPTKPNPGLGNLTKTAVEEAKNSQISQNSSPESTASQSPSLTQT